MVDEKSPEVDKVETPVEEPTKDEETKVDEPESDKVLDELSDTEGDSEEDSKDPKDVPKEKADETDDKTTPDDETTPDGEADTDKKDDKEEKIEPQVDAKEEARKGYDARQAERKAKTDEETSNYVAESADDSEKRIRNMEVIQFNNMIQHNENTVVGEYDRVKADPNLQMFNPESEEFNEKLTGKFVKLYEDANIKADANGNLIEVKGSLYEHLKETAGLFKGAIKDGKMQQVRDSNKNKSNSDPKPAAPPPEKKVDPIMEALSSDD